jgi:hypothetical protein
VFNWLEHCITDYEVKGLNPAVTLRGNEGEMKLSFCTRAGNTKRGSITVLLTSCFTGLESAVLQLTILILFFIIFLH